LTLVILVADGARPDTLFGAMDAGHLPALSALRATGMSATLSSVFPSVTGSAYTPFLTGLHPGRAGLPGLRWYDRDRTATLWPAYARSYVGLGGMRADKDLTRDFRTLFELEPRSIGGFTYVGRGLSTARRIGTGWAFGARLAWTHFRGDLDGWMRFDRWLGEEFVRRIVAQKPRVAFLAHPGIDKLSHQFGQNSPRILEAMQTVDHTVSLLVDTFAKQGRSHELEIWIVSDHGHAAVTQHEDLAGRIASLGHGVRAHPWVIGGKDIAVMVSGNAMAHLYLELNRRRRAVWPAFRDRWQPLLTRLLELPAVDLAIVPMADGHAAVHSGQRGSADVFTAGDGTYSYRRSSGDPLGLGEDLVGLDAAQAWERSSGTAYPDALVQLCAIAAAPRAGDIIISATAGWDLRTRWEPINHVSGHGALHRDQMLVPFIASRPLRETPLRTTDIFPTALQRLGLTLPRGLDGVGRA
jgi:arylsulfatase A-like enzyme